MSRRVRVIQWIVSLVFLSVVGMTAGCGEDDANANGGGGPNSYVCDDAAATKLDGTFETILDDDGQNTEYQGAAVFKKTSPLGTDSFGTEPWFTVQMVAGDCSSRTQIVIGMNPEELEGNGLPKEGKTYEGFGGRMSINFETTTPQRLTLGGSSSHATVTFTSVSEAVLEGKYEIDYSDRPKPTKVSGTFTAQHSDNPLVDRAQ